VEKVKDDLARHLKEIKKLCRRDRQGQNSNDEKELESDSEESSDAEEDAVLNRRIGNLKKMVNHHARMLKGEEEEICHDYGEEDVFISGNGEFPSDENKDDELAEAK